MSAKSERKAKVKAEKQAAYGKQSTWQQFRQQTADINQHQLARAYQAGAEFRAMLRWVINRRDVITRGVL